MRPSSKARTSHRSTPSSPRHGASVGGGWNSDVSHVERTPLPPRYTEISLGKSTHPTSNPASAAAAAASARSRRTLRPTSSAASGSGASAAGGAASANPYYAHTTSYAQTHSFLFDESSSRPLHPTTSAAFSTSAQLPSKASGATTATAVHLHTSLPTHQVNEALRVKLAHTQLMKAEVDKKLTFVNMILSKVMIHISINRIHTHMMDFCCVVLCVVCCGVVVLWCD
jgi:hypothetical protein